MTLIGLDLPIVVYEKVMIDLEQIEPILQREARMVCKSCGGISTPNTIFFLESSLQKLLEGMPKSIRLARCLFYHVVDRNGQEVELTGACLRCGKKLTATLCFKTVPFPSGISERRQ